MAPHLEEAWRALRLADRDITAFDLLRYEPQAHVSIVCFHAQQAVEKSLKAVLFSHQIEFERTHDLVRLARLISDQGTSLPVAEEDLRLLNPFAVTYRYDDLEYDLMPLQSAAQVVVHIRQWAEAQVRAAGGNESGHGS